MTFDRRQDIKQHENTSCADAVLKVVISALNGGIDLRFPNFGIRVSYPSYLP